MRLSLTVFSQFTLMPFDAIAIPNSIAVRREKIAEPRLTLRKPVDRASEIRRTLSPFIQLTVGEQTRNKRARRGRRDADRDAFIDCSPDAIRSKQMIPLQRFWQPTEATVTDGALCCAHSSLVKGRATDV